MSEGMPWYVVSYYSDGDAVIESICRTRNEAETHAQRVLQFRDDQDELPRVVVENKRRVFGCNTGADDA